MKKFAVVALFITLIAVGGFMYFKNSHGGTATTQAVPQSDAKIEASIGKAEGKAGDTVEIPINLKGVPSKGVEG